MSNTAASRMGVRGTGHFGSRAFVSSKQLTKALEPKCPVPLTPILEAAVLLIQSFLNTVFT